MAEPKKTTRKRAPRKTASEKALEAKVAELEAKANEPEPQAPATPANPQQFIRNIRNVPVRFKLERHLPGHRGISLKARGERGDIGSITPEDRQDPIFQANLGLLFEVITAEEAAQAVVKQNTNPAQNVHPALAAIKNEKGEGQGEMKLSIEQSHEQAGVTVAKLNEGQVEFDRSGIKNRERGESPGTPEYVEGARPGHAPANEEPSLLSDSRPKHPAEEATGLTVSVNPVQRT